MRSSKAAGRQVEILIAEDSATQREQLQHLLEKGGYKVMVAANGKEALASARRRKPALIISDVLMPELDGYGLCKAIKSDARLKDIPVILVTSLSDSQDVIRGLECGADNFIRKPYEGDYLLSRIDYLLMNREMRKNHRMQLTLEVNLGGRKHFITSERQQILDLLISTYEQAVHLNRELVLREKALAHSNQSLAALFGIAEELNKATSERAVAEGVLKRALELPGVRAGWITVVEDGKFRLLATCNLPPALEAPGAMEGPCLCRRKLLAGELDSVTNILECERLQKAEGDTQGLRYHASVPIWIGGEAIGIMNLVGSERGLFNDDDARNLYAVGNQFGIALSRARVHDQLEQRVRDRTAKLTAEIEERKRIETEQARLVAIIEATPDMVATGDSNGHVLYCNPAGLRMLGFEPGLDVSTVRYLDTHPEWAAKQVAETGIPHAIEHGTWSGETALLNRDGFEIPVLQVIIAHKGPDGAVDYFSTIVRDISQRKEHEVKVARLNRVYSVLSGINTLIVRVGNRQELFNGACRIAVEQGGFGIAWIGMLNPETLAISPAACAGVDAESLLARSQNTARGDSPMGQGVVGRTIREKRAVFSNNLPAETSVGGERRKEAIRRGYLSVIALPLLVDGVAVGSFSLFAKDANFFDADEVRLLTELAGDISFALDHIAKEEKLNYLAYYDALTGLPNRALFDDRMTQVLRAASHEHSKTALVLIDLERFRVINDTLGRGLADELLKLVAARLQSVIFDRDSLARVHADVFAGLFPDIKDEADIARLVEEKIIGCLNQPFMIGGQEVRVSAKSGVALFPGDALVPDALFSSAEAALRQAKDSSDRYLFYARKMNAQVAERLKLESKLQRAIELEQFVLFYQPKVDLSTGRVAGLEALIRWNDPEAGLVMPMLFIPLLEETGMIAEVGAWAMQQAVSQYAAWQAAGLQPPPIAVNVSAVQLKRKDFVASVQYAVAIAGKPDHGLDLEITESMIMEDIEASIEKLKLVRDLGVGIFIDDFGTGHSSLRYLTRLPITALKIDRAFIQNMATNADDVAIVTTVIALGHNLNLKVVAEGVETEEQRKFLQLLRCDQFQGYLFSKPVPAEQIPALLAR